MLSPAAPCHPRATAIYPLAFLAPLPVVPARRGNVRVATSRRPRRRPPSRARGAGGAARMRQEGREGSQEQDQDREQDREQGMDAAAEAPSSEGRPRLFVDDDRRAFWNDIDVSKTFGPITEEEKAVLREKLPEKVARFLIRRSEDAVNTREGIRSDGSFLGSFLKDLPSDVTDWEDEEEAEYKGYVYETTTGPPSYRRKGSSLFGGGDGLPDVDDISNAYQHDIDGGDEGQVTTKMNLFVGNPHSIDERASQVGYTLLVLLGGLIIFKVLIAFISFFVSFTFSFVAIFALSAGIFVVFFLLRF